MNLIACYSYQYCLPPWLYQLWRIGLLFYSHSEWRSYRYAMLLILASGGIRQRGSCYLDQLDAELVICDMEHVERLLKDHLSHHVKRYSTIWIFQTVRWLWGSRCPYLEALYKSSRRDKTYPELQDSGSMLGGNEIQRRELILTPRPSTLGQGFTVITQLVHTPTWCTILGFSTKSSNTSTSMLRVNGSWVSSIGYTPWERISGHSPGSVGSVTDPR